MNKKEILDWLAGHQDQELFQEAAAVTERSCGSHVYIRGLIEFSNCCIRNCRYCGLQQDNRQRHDYRMSVAEILFTCDQAVRQGIRTVVLQSGDDPQYSRQTLCRIIKALKMQYPDVAVTLSVGERPEDDYRAFRESGTDRYLLKHETANPDLYGRLHPGQSLEQRFRILELLRKLGYQTGTGFIVGLPGQTTEDLAADLLFLKEFKPEMAGIGPFIPHRDTSLALQPAGNPELTLRAIALARILVPTTLLPATTALVSQDPEQGLVQGLKAGCNVVMLNCTPSALYQHYTIYDHQHRVLQSEIEQAVQQAGRVLSRERGDGYTNYTHFYNGGL